MSTACTTKIILIAFAFRIRPNAPSSRSYGRAWRLPHYHPRDRAVPIKSTEPVAGDEGKMSVLVLVLRTTAATVVGLPSALTPRGSSAAFNSARELTRHTVRRNLHVPLATQGFIYSVSQSFLTTKSTRNSMKTEFFALAIASGIAIANASTVSNAAVYPLETSSLSKQDIQLVTDMLSVEIAKTRAFNVMERSQMNRILEEQGFQNSGSCDASDCIVQIGKLLSIQKIIAGSVGTLGPSWVMNLRIINVESGEIENQISVQSESSISNIRNTLIIPAVEQLTNTKISDRRDDYRSSPTNSPKLVQANRPPIRRGAISGHITYINENSVLFKMERNEKLSRDQYFRFYAENDTSSDGWIKMRTDTLTSTGDRIVSGSVASGFPAQGTPVYRVKKSPLALEYRIGTKTDEMGTNFNITETFAHNCILWYRTHTFSEFWIGLGGEYQISEFTKQGAKGNLSQAGASFAIHKGITLSGRFAAFSELGASYLANTEERVSPMQYSIRAGSSVELSPGLRFSLTAGLDRTEISEQGPSNRAAFGCSFIWIP